MKKTILAGAIALTLGAAMTTASAATISMTQMNFGGPSPATGSISSDLTGSFSGTFFGAPWTATAQSYFIGAGAYTWAGTSPQGAFSYNFSLTASEIGFGLFFDWSVNAGIPVMSVYDCGDFSVGNACVGTGPGTMNGGYPMQVGPFVGQDPSFNGILTVAPDDMTVIPVPAAVWLLGSGLLGLVGVARRRKQA